MSRGKEILMKAFQTAFCFTLPDEFGGTVADALRLVADYEDKVRLENDGITPDYGDEISLTDAEEKLLDQIWSFVQRKHEAVSSKGRRYVGMAQIAELNDGDTEWTYFDMDGQKVNATR